MHQSSKVSKLISHRYCSNQVPTKQVFILQDQTNQPSNQLHLCNRSKLRSSQKSSIRLPRNLLQRSKLNRKKASNQQIYREVRRKSKVNMKVIVAIKQWICKYQLSQSKILKKELRGKFTGASQKKKLFPRGKISKPLQDYNKKKTL